MIPCGKASGQRLRDSSTYTTTATSLVRLFSARLFVNVSPSSSSSTRTFHVSLDSTSPYHSFVQAVSSRFHLDKNEDVSHWPPENISVFGHCRGSGGVVCFFYRYEYGFCFVQASRIFCALSPWPIDVRRPRDIDAWTTARWWYTRVCKITITVLIITMAIKT